MKEPALLTEKRGHISIVTINRPDKKNAVNAEVLCRLNDAWVELDEDSELRVLVLTGAGGNFCSGMDLQVTGNSYSSDACKEMGLIGHVVPDGRAMNKALEIAERIAANGPLAVQAILKSIREVAILPEREAFDRETAIGLPVFGTKDGKEGPEAFLEKRKPVYRGE